LGRRRQLKEASNSFGRIEGRIERHWEPFDRFRNLQFHFEMLERCNHFSYFAAQPPRV
jgi:hypothetical protein